MFRHAARFAVAAALLSPTVGHAQFSESYAFLKAVRDRDGTKVTEALNKPGTVMIDTRDPATGESAIHIVTRGRDGTWLGFMVGRGAKLDLRDGKGNTALMIAAQLGWAEGAELLLKRGANVNLANASGETPLIRAVQNRDLTIARILLAGGADANRPDNAAGLSARDYAARDPRAASILKAITETRPIVRREVAGPR